MFLYVELLLAVAVLNADKAGVTLH